MYVPILHARPGSPNSGPEHGARGENMSDDKIKIKDLCGDISQDSKDVLRAARELGLPVKSATGSVTSEEATRLRDYFAEQKQVDAERTGSHPSVIVRRRRKDSPDAEPAAHAGAEKLGLVEGSRRAQRLGRQSLHLLARHAAKPHTKQAHTAGPLCHVGQKLAPTTTHLALPRLRPS